MPALASVTSLSTRACGLWRPDTDFLSLYLAQERSSGDCVDPTLAPSWHSFPATPRPQTQQYAVRGGRKRLV